MLKKEKIFLLISSVFLLLGSAHSTLAGFGVSPPSVFSDKVLPGTVYEQRVTLLRSEADKDLVANIVVKAPEIAEWITTDKGMFFDLPSGQIQIPITFYINVPKDAPIGKYSGKIDINVSDKSSTNLNGIELGVGAEIGLDIALTRDIFRDFLVKNATIADLELPKKPWDMPIFSRLFRRLQVSLKIENIGNEKIAPTKVAADIYDISEVNLLEYVEDKTLKNVLPYQTSVINASLPLGIGPGQYWARVKVYKGKDIISSDKIAFTVLSAGAFKKSDTYPWIIIFAVLLLTLLAVKSIFKIKIIDQIINLTRILIVFIIKLFQKISASAKKINVNFWHWFYGKFLKNRK